MTRSPRQKRCAFFGVGTWSAARVLASSAGRLLLTPERRLRRIYADTMGGGVSVPAEMKLKVLLFKKLCSRTHTYPSYLCALCRVQIHTFFDIKTSEEWQRAEELKTIEDLRAELARLRQACVRVLHFIIRSTRAVLCHLFSRFRRALQLWPGLRLRSRASTLSMTTSESRLPWISHARIRQPTQKWTKACTCSKVLWKVIFFSSDAR